MGETRKSVFSGFSGVGGKVRGRGLHSFPFQLNLSTSVHRITQLNSCVCPEIAQVEL